MQIPFVDLKTQYLSIKSEIDNAIQNVLSDTAFIKGKYVEEFEKNFAKKFNAKYCIGVASGTDAIFIALKILKIGQGDQVITAANTFIATSEAISGTGADVVFVDCNPETYNIDVNKIEEKITDKTKAIIPVHLYGQPADMNPIIKLAKKYHLFIVEDCAQAHFAEYLYLSSNDNKSKWRRVGTLGNIGAFSFYPGKNLGAYGDAGAIITNDDSLAKKIKMYANHGRISKYNHEIQGINSRMDGIQGAILNVKLKYLRKWIEKRRKVADTYNELLKDVWQVICPKVNNNAKHVYHLYVVRVKQREELRKFLQSKGIATGIHYPIALPNLIAYKYLGHKPKDFPVASKYEKQLLSLPVYPEIKKEQIEYVVENIKQFYNKTV
jgi:dTDP-4-amino-4,6-dideoxygalactose transaminase